MGFMERSAQSGLSARRSLHRPRGNDWLFVQPHRRHPQYLTGGLAWPPRQPPLGEDRDRAYLKPVLDQVEAQNVQDLRKRDSVADVYNEVRGRPRFKRQEHDGRDTLHRGIHVSRTGQPRVSQLNHVVAVDLLQRHVGDLWTQIEARRGARLDSSKYSPVEDP